MPDRLTKSQRDKLNAAIASTNGRGWDGHVPGTERAVRGFFLMGTAASGSASAHNHSIKGRGLRGLRVRIG